MAGERLPARLRYRLVLEPVTQTFTKNKIYTTRAQYRISIVKNDGYGCTGNPDSAQSTIPPSIE